MADTIPVIWGRTSDGQDAYVHSCTKAVYNPETGKSLAEEMATCIPDSGENLPPTPIDAATLQGHAADYFVAQVTLDAQQTYSTEEQWTGEYWVDGKKIYKKTFTGGSLSAGTIILEQNDQISRIIKSEFSYSTLTSQFAPAGGFINNQLEASWIWVNAVSYNLSTKNLEAIFTGGDTPSLVNWFVTVYCTKVTE